MTLLFEPYQLGGVRLKNRAMISPMCQYSAVAGVAQSYHLANYGQFAMGGAGLVMVEVTAVSPEGMGTAGDLGLWTDDQQAALARVAEVISELGAVPAIQLGHAGRKGSSQRPWHGGRALTDHDQTEPARRLGRSSRPLPSRWPPTGRSRGNSMLSRSGRSSRRSFRPRGVP